MTTANDLLMAGGVPAARFPTPGTTVSGRIIREPEAREQTDFTTGAVLRWDNGDPRMQIVVQLQTDERDPQDRSDDGTRALYIKGQMLNAVRGAVRQSDAAGLSIDGQLSITYTGDAKPSRQGLNGAKQYTARYITPTTNTAADVLAKGEPTETTPDPWGPPAAPQQPAPAGDVPAGIDPALWAQLDPGQRASVLAASAGTR
jgi:hypothetical protein